MNKNIKPVLRRHSPPQNRKPVRCIETGVVYACVRDAADLLIEDEICVSPEDIRKVCLGRRATAGRLRWEYVDDLSVI
ncbi:hypothetical protein LBMAG20_00040 [Methylocystaceae bacterium]|nr:hypothetical protein LBMAG20_00040 [Methylocystaceae bacterium]